ncbi:MAG: hypothetical protein MZV64_04685 [Ignavibacteriales bacterium]|nr:hypothetical protein [Ignavibacteriales bacterium]
MAEALHARERHHRQERPDVQAGRGRIEADVAASPSRGRARRAGPRWTRTPVPAIPVQ